MAITVEEVLQAVERWAPSSLAEPWDNVGLQVGSRRQEVRRLGVALDLSQKVLEQALAQRVDCLVSHHPLLFKPPKVFEIDSPLGYLLRGLIKHDIALIAAHTNLDIAQGGVNDVLVRSLHLQDVAPLSPLPGNLGLGRVGFLPEPLSVEAFARQVGKVLGLTAVQLVGSCQRLVCKVAVCGGAGGGLLPLVKDCGAEVYLTGELKHHEAREAELLGVPVIVAGHFETEVVVVPQMARFFKEYFEAQEDLDVLILKDESPFKLITGL